MAQGVVFVCGCNVKTFGHHWRAYRIYRACQYAMRRNLKLLLGVEKNLTEEEVKSLYHGWVHSHLESSIEDVRVERTIDEIRYVAKMLKRDSQLRVTFCTSFWHIPRVILLAHLVMDQEMRVRVGYRAVKVLPPIARLLRDIFFIPVYETLGYLKILLKDCLLGGRR